MFIDIKLESPYLIETTTVCNDCFTSNRTLEGNKIYHPGDRELSFHVNKDSWTRCECCEKVRG